jgi:hypothetical protein
MTSPSWTSPPFPSGADARKALTPAIPPAKPTNPLSAVYDRRSEECKRQARQRLKEDLRDDISDAAFWSHWERKR